MHSRKSLLFNNNKIQVKQDNPDFDVTMGNFDRAEVCESVGLYLLNILKLNFVEKISDSTEKMVCFENNSGHELEKIEKKIYESFKDDGLNITIENYLHITDYLHVTVNLKTGKYYPYRK